MNYLLEAAQMLGIYYTPPQVMRAITEPQEPILGNPPFTTYRRIRRPIMCICTTCGGSGHQATKTGPKLCIACGGTGDVERWIVEVVADE